MHTSEGTDLAVHDLGERPPPRARERSLRADAGADGGCPRGRPPIEPVAEDFQLPRILAALADPHRLAVVQYVGRKGESWFTQVMQETGLAVAKSTFAHHLRVLREAGVLTKRIQGTKGYTRVRKEDLDRRFPGLMDSIIDADASHAGGTSSP